MKKFICILGIIAAGHLFAGSKSTTTVQIHGLKGKALINLEKRLDELKEVKPLNELSPEELRLQIINALQPFGYFKAEVEVQVSKDIKIDINTGPVVYIRSYHLQLLGEGASNPTLLKTVRKLPIKIGQPFDSEQYSLSKLKLLNTAENLGYLHASFKKAEILIDEEANTAEITLLFDTGSLYYFGQVQFDPTNINPALLHRYVPFHPGQTYSAEQVLKFNNDLSGSGYFNSVLVKPQISDDTTVPVLVHFQPVSKYSYSLGVGYGTDTGIRGRAAMHIIPVNRLGHKFNALAQGSFRQSALQAQYVVPGANPAVDQYSLTGNFSNLNYDTGYSNSVLASLAQQHNLDKYQRTLSINGLYESFNYSEQPTTGQFVFYPKATFSFVKTENKLFSPSGYNVTFNGLGASEALLSKLNFAQTSVDAKAALTIDALRLRLYGHALYGVTATKDINQLPLTLALLLGGTDNLKGYSFNSIGPGKIINYAGFEVQKETAKNWYLLGFYDAGAVYNPSIKNMQYDVGGGIMWASPIGPIKIGVAQPVTGGLHRVEGSGPRLVIRLGPDL